MFDYKYKIYRNQTVLIPLFITVLLRYFFIPNFREKFALFTEKFVTIIKKNG